MHGSGTSHKQQRAMYDKTMKAARYHGKEDIRIESIPREPIKPGYIRIAPAFVGICGTVRLDMQTGLETHS